jgi:hypothetical protein
MMHPKIAVDFSGCGGDHGGSAILPTTSRDGRRSRANTSSKATLKLLRSLPSTAGDERTTSNGGLPLTLDRYRLLDADHKEAAIGTPGKCASKARGD